MAIVFFGESRLRWAPDFRRSEFQEYVSKFAASCPEFFLDEELDASLQQINKLEDILYVWGVRLSGRELHGNTFREGILLALKEMQWEVNFRMTWRSPVHLAQPLETSGGFPNFDHIHLVEWSDETTEENRRRYRVQRPAEDPEVFDPKDFLSHYLVDWENGQLLPKFGEPVSLDEEIGDVKSISFDLFH